MLSYTEMASTQKPMMVDVTQVMADPQGVEDWMDALPPNVRTNLQSQLTAVVRGLPPIAQSELASTMVNAGHSLPMSMTIDGIGYCGCGPGAAGLGQWGALVGSLIQAGAGIAQGVQSAQLAKSLASKQAATDTAIAKAQADAAMKTQQLLVDAQLQAAQLAAQASVARTQANAPVIASVVRWGGISIAGIALITAGVIFIRRKRKKA